MKDGIALVFGAGKKPKSGPMEEGGDDEMPAMPSMEDIAGDLLDAIKANDKAGVAKALKASHACAGEDEGDEE